MVGHLLILVHLLKVIKSIDLRSINGQFTFQGNFVTLTLDQWQHKSKRSQGKYDGTYHASYRMVANDRHKHQHIGNNKRTT